MEHSVSVDAKKEATWIHLLILFFFYSTKDGGRQCASKLGSSGMTMMLLCCSPESGRVYACCDVAFLDHNHYSERLAFTLSNPLASISSPPAASNSSSTSGCISRYMAWFSLAILQL